MTVVSYDGIDMVNIPADKFYQYLRSRPEVCVTCDVARLVRLADRCLHISQGEILLSVPHIEPNCLTQFVSTFQHYLETMPSHHITVSLSLVLTKT